jgi:hypothetical protein
MLAYPNAAEAVDTAALVLCCSYITGWRRAGCVCGAVSCLAVAEMHSITAIVARFWSHSTGLVLRKGSPKEAERFFAVCFGAYQAS